jgi:hypothetical protein
MLLSPRVGARQASDNGSGSSSSNSSHGVPSPPRNASLESLRAPDSSTSRRSGRRCILSCLVDRAWWTALVLVVVILLCTLFELLSDVGTSNLHLRAATLRAAGGSARLGAAGMCCVRMAEASIVWLIVYLLRHNAPRRARSSPSGMVSQLQLNTAGMSSHGCNAGPLSGGSCGGFGSSPSMPKGSACEAGSCIIPIDAKWPNPNYPPDCASPAELKEQLRHRQGTELLCTLSGWVWATLGCFGVLGATCSLLVAMGGHSAPGMLGEMLSHDGMLGRRSVLGRSLVVLAWVTFEVGSAGALLVAAVSVVTVAPQLMSCASSGAQRLGWNTHACLRPRAAGGAEPPVAMKLRSLGVHLLAVLIATCELCFNDLPVLWQHLPFVLLLGCAFGLNMLAWQAHTGRFSYLYAVAPRTSQPAVLLACVLTPAALAFAFAALASLSATIRVRGLD